MRATVIMLCSLYLLTCCGCQHNSAQSGHPPLISGNLLGRLGLRPGQVVTFVVDTGSEVRVIEDYNLIRCFYDGVNYPVTGRSRCPLDELIGFTKADGRTVVGGFNRSGGVSFHQSLGKAVSNDLFLQLWKDPKLSDTTSLPPFMVASASLLREGSTAAASRHELLALQNKGRELVDRWNPNSLYGCAKEEERVFLSRQKEPVVILGLADPITFRCFVREQVKKWPDWPPNYPEWAGSCRSITVDRLAVAKDKDGHVQLGFYVPADRQWYVTQRLRSYNRRELGAYRKLGELYEGMVKLASP